MPNRKKILLIEIQQETNSFSPIATKLSDFESFVYFLGDEIFEKSREKYPKFQVTGFAKAREKYGKDTINVVPVISAWANSGGPLEIEAFDYFKKIVSEAIIQHADVSGIFLSMHGAMSVQGIADAEGEMLEFIRNLVGNNIAIAMPLDLHANITQKMVKYATLITAYRTNPHRDHFDVGYKAAKLLIDTVLGKIKPVMVVKKMKLLKGGGLNIDFLPPMRQVFRCMNTMEKQKDVLSVAIFMVHIWLDAPELGWATVAITDDNQPLAEKMAIELADINWNLRDKKHPTPDLPEIAIDKIKKAWLRRKFGTAVICDLSDAVAAGAPGENTHIIRAIATQAPELRAYTSIKDSEVANATYNLPLGVSVSVSLGGKLEKQYNSPFAITAKIIHKHFTEYSGKMVLLQCHNTFIVVSENANPVFYPAFYQEMGLNIWRADIIVVKNLFPFRYHFLRYNRQTINVITPGTTQIDVFGLDYKQIPRPIYPLDLIENWQ